MEQTETPEQRFEEAFQVADAARQSVIQFLETVSQSDSQHRPDSDQWSIGEIAHHLVLVERRFRDRILRITAEGEKGPFKTDEVLAGRPFKLEDSVDADKVGKGKAPEFVWPSAGLAIAQLTAQLGGLREETRSQLASLRAVELGDFWWEHPRLGPMTLYELILYMGYHETRHLSQMKQCLPHT